jgi:hypothetical protein
MDTTGDEILKYSKKRLKQIVETTLGPKTLDSFLESKNLEWCFWHNSAICEHNILIPFNSVQQTEI